MNEYTSTENYKNLFADIICEVSDDDCSDERIQNMFAGFEQAIIELMGYHDDALKRLRTLHGMFIRADFQGEGESILD